MAVPAAGMLGELAVTGDFVAAWESWANAIKAGAAVDAGLGIAGAVADYSYKRSRVGEKRGEKHKGDFLSPPRKKKSDRPDDFFISPIKKSNMPKRNIYQGSTTRAAYKKKITNSGTVVTTYKKPLVKKYTKKGGSSRIFDMIAPPLVIYNPGYFPRCLLRTADMGDVMDKTSPSSLNFECLQFPMFTTREIATYIIKSKEVPHSLAWDKDSIFKGSFEDNLESKVGKNVPLTYEVENADGSNTTVTENKYLYADKKLDNSVYGFVESAKITYKIVNPNECPVTIDLMEVRPRHAITDLDQLQIQSNTLNSDGDVVGQPSYEAPASGPLMPLGAINPLLCMKKDWEEREDYLTNLKSGATTSWYPNPVPQDQDPNHVNEWQNQDITSRDKYFNRYYKILSHKKKTLAAGETFMYDVVIPGFGFNFDRYLQDVFLNAKDLTSSTLHKFYWYKLREVQSTFTRFLMIRHRGVPQYAKTDQTPDDSGNVPWIMNRKVYPSGLKLNLTCKKYIKTRLVPAMPKTLTMKTQGKFDIDAFGIMNESQSHVKSSGDASDLMRFGGVQVTGVNTYPNVVKIEGSTSTG
jgi:hypothetical protein